MRLEIDKNSPIPLYYQIVEAISYEIATGKISGNSSLPSVRDLAAILGVNLHTVRHAYLELEKMGFVEINGPKGTKVTTLKKSFGERFSKTQLERYISDFFSKAKRKYNLEPEELANLVINHVSRWKQKKPPTLFVIECTESQCLDHIQQIETLWEVNAKPWCLSQHEDLPGGKIISTYFHLNDIRLKWPNRFKDVHFVTIQPNPDLPNLIIKKFGNVSTLKFIMCHLDMERGPAIYADLKTVLPSDKFHLKTCIVKKANEKLYSPTISTPMLFTPRGWAELTVEEQSNPWVMKVKYVITKKDLESLGTIFNLRHKIKTFL